MWILLIGISAAIGFAFGRSVKGIRGSVLSALVPWLLLLVTLLLTEYVVPYSGGVASMWPVAQLVGGTVAAAFGLLSFLITTTLKKNPDEKTH